MDPAYTHFIHPAVKARLSFQVECSSHKLVWSPGGSPDWLRIQITEWAQNWDFDIVYLEQGVSVFNKFCRWFWHRWFAFGTREVGDTIWILNSVLFLFLFLFFFYRRITASQHCVDLCHTSTWISHRHTMSPPSWTHLPSLIPSVLLILFMMPIVLLFTLFTLLAQFTEPRVGKARAKRLEEDLRSRRNCKYFYCLLADAAAIAIDMLYSLFSWLTQQTQLWHSSNAATF